MAQYLRKCPDCDTPFGEPYQHSHLNDLYYEFFECAACGKQVSLVYRFSHLETDEEDDEEDDLDVD